MRSLIVLSCALLAFCCLIASSSAQYGGEYGGGYGGGYDGGYGGGYGGGYDGGYGGGYGGGYDGGYGGQGGYQDYNYNPGQHAQAQGVGTWAGKALRPAGTFLYKGLQGMVEGFGNQAGQAAGEAVFHGNQYPNNQG